MEFFTKDDFKDMKITKMSYDEETRGWVFLVSHSEQVYYLKDFTLPHPDEVKDDGHIVSVIHEKMLAVKNQSTKEVVKQTLDVYVESILEKPISDLKVTEYVQDEKKPELLEYDGPGYGDFFLDNYTIYKGNINITLNTESFVWFPGKYMKSYEWVQSYDYRLINVNGNKIRLFPINRENETKQGSWEYWDGEISNTIVFNGMVTRDITMDGALSKYNVHIIFNLDSYTWRYGGDNIDVGWLGEGKTIMYNSNKITIKNNYTFNI